MVITSKITSIAIIIISFLISLAVFYVINDSKKSEKKIQMEELISHVINFVIYIWIGKILLNLSLFIEDPLAILAYPSNAEAFYIAVLLSAGTLAIQSSRQKINVISFLYAFTQVFLISSFLYAFIQLVWENNTFAFGYIVLSAVALITFYLIRDHVTKDNLITVILSLWSAGMVFLTFIQPFVTIFGYIMKPWFIVVFFITTLFMMFVKRRREHHQ